MPVQTTPRSAKSDAQQASSAGVPALASGVQPPATRPAGAARAPDALDGVLARSVALRVASSGPLLQRYVVVPTVAAWKKDTAGLGMRSKELKAIDAALDRYHAPGTDAIGRRAALDAIKGAVTAWEDAHKGDKRAAAVKELEDISWTTRRAAEGPAQLQIGQKLAYVRYEQAITARQLATAAAEASALIASPQPQEFNDYLVWALGGGETDAAKLAMRFLTAPGGRTRTAVLAFVEHGDLGWIDAVGMRWVYQNVLVPLHDTSIFAELLKHPGLLPALATLDQADYLSLVAATPALEVVTAVRAAQQGGPPPGVFAVADALFAEALGGTSQLDVAYLPTSVGGMANALTMQLNTPATLMCHSLARMFFDLFGIYAADAGAGPWSVKVVPVKDPLLTKPVAGLTVLAGARGLVQQHNHPGNVLDDQTMNPTGQIFFNPGPDEPSHSYVRVDDGGQSRCYDPIFGIAWDGDWRNNANAGVEDLFTPDATGFRAQSSNTRIRFHDKAGAQPFTNRYVRS
jgi:hypothetical protein